MPCRILFILKFRDNPLEPGYIRGPGYGLSSGLLNSAKFVVDMLGDENYDVKLVQVVDNNRIDEEVSIYRPTHCIIEALWVVPDKFEVLQKLHPTVKWIIRGHSEVPFLANEGVAMKWISRYAAYENVTFAANSPRSLRDIRTIVRIANPAMTERELHRKIAYLPNYYPYDREYPCRKRPDGILDVCCFGAIRPLKNQLLQAVAALEYARAAGKRLRFHVNSSRTEQKGDNVLKNLRSLFEATGQELVEHPWMTHREFLHALGGMDLAMQVSFTETFNIVAADCVTMRLPMVASPDVVWLNHWAQASPTDSADMVRKMRVAASRWYRWWLKRWNLRGLRRYCEKSRLCWLEYFPR